MVCMDDENRLGKYNDCVIPLFKLCFFTLGLTLSNIFLNLTPLTILTPLAL